MRYINMLDRTSRVKTRNCFVFNNTVYFAVDKKQVSRAIGPDANNVKKLQENIGKRIKIIGDADGVEQAEKFFLDVVSPVKFKSLEVKDGIIVIAAGSAQNKAALIGRNKRRLEELKKVSQNTFGKDLKVV